MRSYHGVSHMLSPKAGPTFHPESQTLRNKAPCHLSGQSCCKDPCCCDTKFSQRSWVPQTWGSMCIGSWREGQLVSTVRNWGDLLVNNDCHPACITEEYKAINTDFFVPLVKKVSASVHYTSIIAVTHRDAKLLHKPFSSAHGRQRWNKPTITKPTLHNIIGAGPIDKELGFFKELSHALNIRGSVLCVTKTM